MHKNIMDHISLFVHIVAKFFVINITTNTGKVFVNWIVFFLYRIAILLHTTVKNAGCMYKKREARCIFCIELLFFKNQFTSIKWSDSMRVNFTSARRIISSLWPAAYGFYFSIAACCVFISLNIPGLNFGLRL